MIPQLRATAAGKFLCPNDGNTVTLHKTVTEADTAARVGSGSLPGLVQTSLNLGILTTGEDAVELHFGVRSSLASQKEMLTERLTVLTRQLGGSVEVFGDYPAWEYRAESPLRELMCEVYREQYGAEPKIEAIHAGLECGLLCEKLPGLDCCFW